MTKEDDNLSTHDAIKALAAKAIANGEVTAPAIKEIAAKVIAMVESARKDEGTVALMKEVRKAYGLPPK